MSIKLNALYFFYWQFCKFVYLLSQKRAAKSQEANALRDIGVIRISSVLDNDKVDKISEKISNLAEEERYTISETDLESVYVQLKNPLTNIDRKLIEIVNNPKLSFLIENYFQSFFKVLWLDCYRTFPTEKRESSWLWHIDNHPIGVMKGMLILTDSDESTGSTHFISKLDTQEIYNNGYDGVVVNERQENIDEYSPGKNVTPIIFNVNAGDVLLFSANNLHKAVPPQRGFRDVATFLIVPSYKKWKKKTDKNELNKIDSNPGGYPIFPWKQKN